MTLTPGSLLWNAICQSRPIAPLQVPRRPCPSLSQHRNCTTPLGDPSLTIDEAQRKYLIQHCGHSLARCAAHGNTLRMWPALKSSRTQQGEGWEGVKDRLCWGNAEGGGVSVSISGSGLLEKSAPQAHRAPAGEGSDTAQKCAQAGRGRAQVWLFLTHSAALRVVRVGIGNSYLLPVGAAPLLRIWGYQGGHANVLHNHKGWWTSALWWKIAGQTVWAGCQPGVTWRLQGSTLPGEVRESVGKTLDPNELRLWDQRAAAQGHVWRDRGIAVATRGQQARSWAQAGLCHAPRCLVTKNKENEKEYIHKSLRCVDYFNHWVKL